PLSAPAGTIYYTLDAGDPRRVGGGVSSTAIVYSGPVTLTRATRLLSRARVGTNWSALVDTQFFRTQDFSGLRLTEIMYNPPPSGTVQGGQFEFLEFKNIGTTELDLGACTMKGLSLTMTNGTLLAPGAFLVLASDVTNFLTRYPAVPLQGTFPG